MDRLKKFYKIAIQILILSTLSLLLTSSSNTAVDKVTVSKNEYKLYKLINQYRASKNLPAIPLSKSLTYVAQVHCKDLVENQPDKGKCNMHSWSNKGNWEGCCYTSDHKKASCMWNKPSELTNYPSSGFEISHWSSYQSGDGVPAEQALQSWKSSNGHNNVIINRSVWKNKEWKAIGIGIHKNYACVWFGLSEDPAGEIKRPK